MNEMDIIKTFASLIEALTAKNPVGARQLLLAGYRAQRLALSLKPDKKLPPSKQYAARTVMDMVIRALAHPEKAALVSIFVPCEPLAAAGIAPYSAEALSGYLAATKCETIFLEHTAGKGVPETLCSFHRIFIGAAATGLMPKPKFMIYTNLACDGNLITFPYLKRKYEIPAFFIDVPYEKSGDSVRYVAGQLKEMCAFISEVTGRPIPEDALRQAVARSERTAANYLNYLSYQKERRLPGDLTSEMYGVFMSHILLGTEQAEKYSGLLLKDIQNAGPSSGLRLLWLHLIPYLQAPVKEVLNFSAQAFIAACELTYESLMPVDVSKPYEAMARRMVYSCHNGAPERRVAQALEIAGLTGAEGAVIFAHWGCKSTIGAAQLIKDALEKAALPALILDGDCCDPANSSDGQTATRLGAFLEMLEEKRK
ncbi:2-hydroxyacyl-CoA dehydratase family protein [Desulfosporosinus sp. PR]|uniref:2-hydroxyacyl-CoA dehydratase subunit D n=1 Tax=Candidatus Desulfosporosinus nitrosoreducens TaxID=3401928 RepID=UPI0027F8FD05|nr:2-hydroxyacyl-CoA dehydratase family protein [Desulfosporosinus sp. PR]MDQ7092171.1 2-hydroxyacyl-CoA dehydratase family protein [Desulfosporosinus sp. PR]